MERLHTFYHQLKLLFPPIQPFDAELESLYQSDFRNQFYEQLKLTVIVGTAIAFLFIIWDFTNLDIAPYAWAWRLPLPIIGYFLWRYMELKPEDAKSKLFHIGLFAISIITITLLAMLISVNNAEYYIRLYPGMLLVFAYMYGAFFVPVKPGLIFCVSTTIVMVILEAWFSVPLGQSIGAFCFLIYMSLIGAYSRHQLEIFSRRSFLDKRNVIEKQLLLSEL